MYTLTVKYLGLDNCTEFTFKKDLPNGIMAGRFARRYATWPEVFSVELVSKETGEVLFAHNKRDEYYWNVLGVE